MTDLFDSVQQPLQEVLSLGITLRSACRGEHGTQKETKFSLRKLLWYSHRLCLRRGRKWTGPVSMKTLCQFVCVYFFIYYSIKKNKRKTANKHKECNTQKCYNNFQCVKHSTVRSLWENCTFCNHIKGTVSSTWFWTISESVLIYFCRFFLFDIVVNWISWVS